MSNQCLPARRMDAALPLLEERASLEAGVAGHYDALDVFYRDLWGERLHHGLWLTGRETPAQQDRSFALAVPLLWLAYRTGAMRYVMLTAQKPPG